MRKTFLLPLFVLFGRSFAFAQIKTIGVVMRQKTFLMISLLLTGFLLGTLTTGYAQSPAARTIKGVVTDENGDPLPGATVVQVKTSNAQNVKAVNTDINGRFTLVLTANAKEIEVSFMGYENKLLLLTEQNEYQISMAPSAAVLEEVVVTGMFTRKANSYTGAVSSIKKEELMKVGNQNVLSSLTTIDPSLMQINNLAAGSNPNAAPNLQMRGSSTLPDIKGQYQSDPSQPLFILDGFETDITKVMDLDMNLVESITTLKDATAKAIYGSKAANGVIVIETRRPEAGKMRITYNGSLNIEAPDLSSYDLTNAAEKLEVERLAGFFYSENVPSHIQLQQRYDAIRQEVLAGVDTYWLSQSLRTGIGTKHALYLEGGDNYMLYGVDLSYNKINGAMRGSDRGTMSGGVSLTYQIKNFQFRNKLSVTNNISHNSPYGLFSTYTLMNPYNRMYDEEGELITSYNYSTLDANIESQSNPIWNSMINTKSISEYTDITNHFLVEYSPMETLKFVGRLGITKQLSSSDDFKPATHTDFVNYTGDDIYRKGSYFKNQGKTTNLNADLGAHYSLTIKKHLLFANAQVNMTDYSYNSYNLMAEGFPNDNMDDISFATQYAKDGSPSGSESVSRSVGAVASINYSFDNRYLFDANYRLTGSSEFGADSRWGSFWSLGGGWNLHEEEFMKGLRFINRLKVRASTGYTGSQGFSNFEAIATLRYYTNASYNGSIGSYLVGLANTHLQWQRKYDQNAGFDFTLFNNNLSGRFDYYVSTTKGMLTDITTPPSTGFRTYRENMGETENKGWEAYLNWRILSNPKKNSYLSVYASASYNKNTLKKIGDSLRSFNDEQDAIKDAEEGTTDELRSLQNTPSVRYVEGQSMNAIWAVRSLGIDPANGKEIYLNKNGEVTYNWSSADQVVCGDMLPKINGIFGLNVEYFNFTLNIAASYQLGGQMYNQTLVDKVENANLYDNVDRRVLTNRWQKTGDVALYKAITDQSRTQPTSRFVEDYNLLNIASVNLTYDFRDFKFVKNSFIDRLRLSVYLNNLLTLSSVKIERGTDYPFARTTSIALQLSF